MKPTLWPILLLCSSCVSATEFDDLKQRYDEAQHKLAERQERVGSLGASVEEAETRDGRMVLQLPTDVLFDSGSAKLSRAGTSAISQVVSVLKEVSNRRYQIEGHTDDVPIHNPQYRSNWELASARGRSVVRAMLDDGIPPSNVSAASYGEFHPVASNADDGGRRANRRIEIIVVPDLSPLPGYEELQLAVQSP